jgi:hypothetical protein
VNAEIVSKTAEVANNAVNALKASPVVLALVIFQLLTLGAILYNTIDRQRANTASFDRLSALLDKCLTGHLNSKP